MSNHDHLLLQHAREGDSSAVQSLLQSHQHALYRVSYSILLDPALARQAVQDALLSAIYTPGKQPTNQLFDLWLKSLTVRASHNLANKRSRKQPPLGASPTPEPPGETPPAIWKAYLELNSDYQIPLALRYFHGYSVEQIAFLIRAGQNTARARLGTARDRLMKALQQVETGDSASSESAAASSIGHDQARFLLQSAMDEHLSAQEWVPLQSHLDHCETCRSYQKKLQGLERELQHVLRARLETSGEMIRLDPEKLLARQRAGIRWRNLLRSAGKALGSLASLAVGLALIYTLLIPGPTPSLPGTLTAEAAQAALVTPTVPLTPTPPLAEPFRTPVVFQSTRDGNAEIYLLDPDGQAINLTHSPAADTDPMWSPDGEWIAFLSDRSGKSEIYLLHVSGARLVQITDQPDVTWKGPVSWSSDGERLAVAGAWAQDEGQTWIYLIQLKSANEVIRLSFTRGASQPRWAPADSQLAYQMESNSGAQIYARRVDRSEVLTINDPQPADTQVFQTPAGGFDWAPDHQGIAFIANGPYQLSRRDQTLATLTNTASQLQTRPLLTTAGVGGNATLAWQAPQGGQILSTSWSPQNLLAFLQSGAQECQEGKGWPLLIATFTQANASTNQSESPDPIVIPGLCAGANLTDFAWSPDGRWLVLAAFHSAGGEDSASALFALDVIKTQADLARAPLSPLPMVRLTPSDGQDSAPQARPHAAQLGIAPTPVQTTPRSEPLSPASLNGAKGKIIFSASEDGNEEVFAVAPNGSGRTNLTQNPANDRFLAAQPGAPGWIAFSSDRGGAFGGPSEIFIMGAKGNTPVQVTNMPTDPHPYVALSYQSFSWSPDGARLAAEVINQNGKYLLLMPSQPSLQDGQVNRYFQLQGDLYTRPLWVENGRKIMMASSGGYAMGLVTVDLVAAPLDAIQAPRINWPEADWGRINDMIEVPQTGQLVFLATRQLSGLQEATVGLFAGDRLGQEIRLLAILQVPNQQYQVLNAEVDWLADTRQFLIHVAAPVDQKIKSTFTLVNPDSGNKTSLWQTEDYAFHQVISPDGQWLLYNTETGLWALNIRATLSGQNGPAQIVKDFVSGPIDWIPSP